MPLTRLRSALPSWRRCKRFLSTNLLLVNTGTSCVLYTAGDLFQQRIEGREVNDWRRTRRMAVLGFLLGPVNHYWYVYLDRVLPGATGKIVAKKVAADQAVMAPVCSTVFYTGMCLLEGRGWSGVTQELSEKFWPTYKMDWKIWPAAQVINFFFVPPTLRVAYVNVVTLIWTVYLSYMKHKDMERLLQQQSRQSEMEELTQTTEVKSLHP